MLVIRTNGEALDLPQGYSLDVEDTSPIFNELGSRSAPATIPATPRNARLLGFPQRIDAGSPPEMPDNVATVSDGAYIRRGVLNVISAGRADGICLNVGFDNSTAYCRWRGLRLADLSSLPKAVKGSDVGHEDSVAGMVDYLSRLYSRPNAERDPLAVFPVALAKETLTVDDNERTYWELINAPDAAGTMRPREQLTRVIDGTLTEISVPDGYALSPFVRVWYLVDRIFAELGLAVEGLYLDRDEDFNKLVVLNNAADAICNGVINYADLMPECTVGEFLNALWVRFGLTYNIDFDRGRATLKLLRDILRENAAADIRIISAGPENITYEAAQYVRLSAKTSLDGAAPPAERFEDFTKGLDIRGVHLGADVSAWKPRQGAGWTGDVRDDWWDMDEPDGDLIEPDYPDSDSDRDDDRNNQDYIDRDEEDPGPYAARARNASKSVRNSECFLAHEFVTGNWYKLDELNGAVKASGSGFFNWDPQTPGLEPFELASDDECVPVMHVNTIATGAAHDFNAKCPAFLAGARHYHSFIKGTDAAEDVSTPLAFMLAYNVGGKTIGRICPEDETGAAITLDDGTKPGLSLFFQFADGLFAKFWADYDEILRHGNRSVEIPVNLEKRPAGGLDLMRPVTFRGVRCLIDSISYALPAPRSIHAKLRLRAISTQGVYDIKAEQGIPDFSAGARHLAWVLKSETFGRDLLEAMDYRVEAARQYVAASGYKPHGTVGDFYEITAAGAIPKRISRAGTTWQTDSALPSPAYAGATLLKKYSARIDYDIHETHDMTVQDGPEDWELSDSPVGSQSLIVEYSVELVARWVLK